MTSSQSELDRARELHRGGAVDAARQIYEEILESNPANAEALHLLGVAALQMGDPERAEDLIGRAIEIDESDARFHNNLGEARRTRGVIQGALTSYRAARALNPDFAQAINNEGAALMALGHPEEAAHCFHDAISADQSYIQAHLNLGLALHAHGDLHGALKALAAARALDPDNLILLQSYAMVAGRAPAEGLDGECEPHVVAALASDGIDTQRLVRPALGLLSISDAFKALSAAHDNEIIDGQHDGALTSEILLGLLRRTVVANTGAEILLTRLRRLCLEDFWRDESGLAERLPTFAAALATQCFLTDYAYAESEAERAIIDELVETAQRTDGNFAGGNAVARTNVIAMYRPLSEVLSTDSDLGGSVDHDLVAMQITAGQQEAAFAKAVPSLTPEADDLDPVQRQYEEAPYPRWVSCDRRIPVPFAHVFGALFAEYPVPDFARQPLRTLIAGCGTGKHAIEVARQYLTTELVALDVSRASLGYAARMAAELKIMNLKFLRADIRELGDWTERFQVIESSGVLHHLDDPMQGWRVLVDKLEPGGFMKVALYSRLGRQRITETRAMVESDSSLVTAQRLREARQAIIELPRDDLRRGVADYVDFYSLRGCRDLLFHTQEHTFALPDIASMLGALNLTFVGFQFADPTAPARYASAYPGAAANDLDQWRIFEQSNPETFAGMYQFWCQKPG